MSGPGGVVVRDVKESIEFKQGQGRVVRAERNGSDRAAASVSFLKQYDTRYEASIAYTLDADGLCCDVTLRTDHADPREGCITFSLPALRGMTKALWPRYGAPFDLDDGFLERVLYRQWDFRTAMVVFAR